MLDSGANTSDMVELEREDSIVDDDAVDRVDDGVEMESLPVD